MGEHLPCKQGVTSSNLVVSIQFIILKSYKRKFNTLVFSQRHDNKTEEERFPVLNLNLK